MARLILKEGCPGDFAIGGLLDFLGVGHRTGLFAMQYEVEMGVFNLHLPGQLGDIGDFGALISHGRKYGSGDKKAQGLGLKKYFHSPLAILAMAPILWVSHFHGATQ